MRRTFTLLVLIAGLILPMQPVFASSDSLRCGTRLIQRYTLAIQVRERCGEPISKEIIGYSLRENRYVNTTRQREFKIEQWLYGPVNGYYNEIIFEGGRVREINRIRR